MSPALQQFSIVCVEGKEALLILVSSVLSHAGKAALPASSFCSPCRFMFENHSLFIYLLIMLNAHTYLT